MNWFATNTNPTLSALPPVSVILSCVPSNRFVTLKLDFLLVLIYWMLAPTYSSVDKKLIINGLNWTQKHGRSLLIQENI